MKSKQSTFLKLCLADSLILLMRKKPYGEIAVTDICEKAGVSRSTFYRNLNKENPKDELLMFRIVQGWEEYREAHPQGRTNTALLAYVYSIKDLILMLSDLGLLRVAMNAFQVIINPSDNQDKSASYALAFLAYGFYGVVYQWIAYRFDEPPEEVEKRIEAIHSQQH